MRNLTRGVVVAVLAAAAVAATAPSASACYSSSGGGVLIYIAKPVPTTVNDPGTITITPMDCITAVQEAVDQH